MLISTWSCGVKDSVVAKEANGLQHSAERAGEWHSRLLQWDCELAVPIACERSVVVDDASHARIGMLWAGEDSAVVKGGPRAQRGRGHPVRLHGSGNATQADAQTDVRGLCLEMAVARDRPLTR